MKRGNFGAGVMFGEPSGITAKLWQGQRNAFDFGLAWSFEHTNSMTMQADYLWHNYNIIKVDEGTMPIYYGVGGRVMVGNEGNVGIRVPVGVNYLFAHDPLGLFFEVAPILDLAPSTNFDLNADVGIRYYFGTK
ncbi:MAG TPA: hypothetical protein VKA08_05230 [Balneolales bacterium]|nr:hypothetical protein [Balneolales bacterium]